MILIELEQIKQEHESEVLMPVRAFIDSDENAFHRLSLSPVVLMPVRAFIDSDTLPLTRPPM